MKTFAKFESRKTSLGHKIFRYHTEFQSDNRPGPVIGLVYMMNPGLARPKSELLFKRLKNQEYVTPKKVETKPDTTMSNVIKMIEDAFEYNGLNLPNRFTIQVENLFTIREEKSKIAQKCARDLTEVKDIMFRQRELNDTYCFVFIAWGKVSLKVDRQAEILKKYPNAITVKKMKRKGKIIAIDYPKHPLGMNKEFFLKASKGKISMG